ncbi:unnamed protein product [Ectocarpus sp. CCAP 1310/34]|nr:unnamed protein product [Ectocarpus sp. CCAP 1310/34]
MEKLNANPTIYASGVARKSAIGRLDASVSRDVIDAEEVFEMIRHVNDPEHPLTLEQLKVVSVRKKGAASLTRQGKRVT